MSEKRIAYDTYIEHQPKGAVLYYAPAGFMDNFRCGATDEATLKGGASDDRLLLAVARGIDHILVPHASVGLQKYVRYVHENGAVIIFRYEEAQQ